MGLDWLDIVQGRHLGGAADRGIREVAVCGHVDFDDERGEEDIHAQTLHADEAASKLTLMGAETVEGVANCRDVEALSNQDAFAIHGNDSRAGAEDGGE